MKKTRVFIGILLLICFLLIGFNAVAADNVVATQAPSAEMQKDTFLKYLRDCGDYAKGIVPYIKQGIEDLSKSLGIAAEKIYTVLIKQAYVQGMMASFWVLLGLVLAILSIIFGVKIIKWVIKDSSCIDDSVMGFAVFGVIACIGALFGGITTICSNLETVIVCFFNPDWYVFKVIIHDIIQNLPPLTK